jgi:prepilin-type N-terminal cleavage/methylation domain-containing protein
MKTQYSEIETLNPKTKGFTLVELAIVMIIIGLLVGGVIKGFQIVENAKIKSVIAQIESIRAASQTFRETYAALPGDFILARTRVQNCNDTTFCVNGDASSIVGVPGNNTSVAHLGENLQFWKHLALANLLNGVVYDADPAGTHEYSVHFPESELKKGGYQVFFRNQAGTTNNHVLRLHSAIDSTFSNVAGSYAIKPIEAFQIDRTLDDSNPGTGRITTSGVGAGSGCEPDVDYITNVAQRNCVVYVDMGF